MPEQMNNKEALAQYRLDMAEERLQSAKILLDVGNLKDSKYLSQAFQIRNNTDYADFFIVSNADAVEQYERAGEFVERIKAYMKQK